MLTTRPICTVLKHIISEKVPLYNPACAAVCTVVLLPTANYGVKKHAPLQAKAGRDNSACRDIHSNRPLSNQQVVCQDTDARLQELLKALRLSEAVALTLKSFAEKRFPSSKTASALISALAREGDVGGVQKTKHIVDTLYPSFSEEQMRFEHCHAEALSRAGRASEAIMMFERLFVTEKGHRVKICSRLTFLAAYLVKEDMIDEVGQLARMCERLAERGYFHPLSNVWRVLFLSEKRRYHATAWELVESVNACYHPQARPFLEKKVNSILSHALDRCDVDAVQRLLNVVLYLGMQEPSGLVLSFLLEFHCDAGDVKNAQRTFEHARTHCIELNPVTLYRYTCFLSSEGIQIPRDVLLMKYKMDPRKARDAAKQSTIKFKF
ncbi:uncharacterized protein LOC144163382 [Haemaphysalis longicornis]